MSDEPLFRLRPSDLAQVWGKAVGQLVEIWRVGITSVLETGSVEADITGSHCNDIVVPAVDGRAPRLFARNLVGESFGHTLDGQGVRFSEKRAAGPGLVVVGCCVDETIGQPILGDIYRGEVVDDRDVRLAVIALDAGS